MNDSFIDLSALRVFLLIARERNMSSAAQRLGVTQSAVSQALRGLEDQLGAVLVNRTDRPLSLTPAGALLAERGGVLMDAAVDMRHAVVGVGQGAHPSLSLGLVDSFAATCGTALVRQCVEWGARVSLRTGLSPELGRGLLAREFDLVICSDGLDEHDGIERHELLREGLILIAPASLQMRAASLDALRQLADRLPLIRFNRQSHLGMQIEHVIRRHGIKASRQLEVDTSDVLTSLVAGELGWALTTPMCLLQAEHLAHALSVHLIDGLVGSRSLYLLALADQHPQVVHKVLGATLDLLRNDARSRLDAIAPHLGDWLHVEPAAPLFPLPEPASP